MTKTALAIRQVAFEDLGLIHRSWPTAVTPCKYLEASIDELDDDAVNETADLLVVLGGPIGANDTWPVPLPACRDQRHPDPGARQSTNPRHLSRHSTHRPRSGRGRRSLRIHRDRLRARGAHAAVARLPLRRLEGAAVLHWHNDRFEIPEGADLLASTPRCAHQSFALGPHIPALQFFLETGHRDVERWLIGHAEALAAAGIDPGTLRRAAAANGPALDKAAARVVEEWLDTE